MRRTLVRLEALLAFGLLAGLLVATGFGFLVAALYLELARTAGTSAAALMTGALCLAGAGLVAVAGWLVVRSIGRRPAASEAPQDASRLALAMGEAVGGSLQAAARRHRYGAIGVALVAGFAIGVSPRLRRALRSLVDG